MRQHLKQSASSDREGKPSSQEALYLRRATSQERRGQYDLAIRSVRKAIEIAPQRVSSYARLAVLYRAARRFDEAMAVLRTAAERCPEDPEIREMLLQLCMESRRYDEAIRRSKELLKQWPRNLYARDVLGLAYIQRGDYDSALRVTEELVNIDPMDPTNHFKKAIIYQQKGNIGAAVVEYGRVVEIDPDSEYAADAEEAIEVLDGIQLRHIITLALEDAVFRAKLTRDPGAAVRERGFVLSENGVTALRQFDFDSMSLDDGFPPGRYVYN